MLDDVVAALDVLRSVPVLVFVVFMVTGVVVCMRFFPHIRVFRWGSVVVTALAIVGVGAMVYRVAIPRQRAGLAGPMVEATSVATLVRPTRTVLPLPRGTQIFFPVVKGSR